MTLQLFGFLNRPHDFATTKANVTLEDCVFILDFSHPLQRLRWLGVPNRWVGITVGLTVPIVHECEQSGGYVFSTHRSEPYFQETLGLWRQHYKSKRTIKNESIDPLELIADFAQHLSEDCP